MSQKDICLFMKEIFYVFSDYAHSKGLKYEFFSNQEVILCWFDSKQLEKVFLNLLSNALNIRREVVLRLKYAWKVRMWLFQYMILEKV